MGIVSSIRFILLTQLGHAVMIHWLLKKPIRHPISRLLTEAFVSELIPTATKYNFKKSAATSIWSLWQVSLLLKHYRHVRVTPHASAAFYLVMSTIQHCTVVSISMSVKVVHVRRTLIALTTRALMNVHLKKTLEAIGVKLTMHAKMWKTHSLFNTTIS